MTMKEYPQVEEDQTVQGVRHLAECSLSIYEKMEQLYRQIASLPLEDAAKIAPFVQQVEVLQQQVAEVDSRLNNALENMKKSVPLSAMLSQILTARAERIEGALQCNRQLVEDAERHKVILQNELASMNKNRQAISGYRAAQIPVKQGQSVEGVF